MSSTVGVISHWNTLLENFQTSPQDFYARLTEAVEQRQIPEASTGRLLLAEGGIMSAKREYLQIACKDFHFAVCAAPFGTGFFVSWWLMEQPLGCLTEAILLTPFVGPLFRMLLTPMTYYRIDTALMFQSATHAAVLEVIDSITSSQGLRGLSEMERKPIMREFYQ